MWARLLNKLRFLLRRDRFEEELAEEMDFHREMLEAEKARQGLAQESAAVSAQRQLGDTMRAREFSREVWIIAWLDTFAADLRYALRTMAASKTFSVLAILSLALGIGANTAIYSFMDSILLRSLPVPDPESLVVLNWHAKDTRQDFVMHGMSGTTFDDPRTGTTAGIFPFPAFELFRTNDSVFSSVFAHCAAHQVRKVNLAVKGQADIASGWSVSGDYFPGLAVPPAAGRLITPDDDRLGAPAVVVLSHRYSQRRFGDAAGAVGQSVLIDNLPFSVVGVAPREFFGVDPAAAPDVFLPMHASELLGAGKQFGFRSEDYLARNYYWVQVMGRLRPGVGIAQAQAALAPAFAQWVAGTAANDRERENLPTLVVKEGAAGLDTLRRRYSQPLYVLLTLVGLILALACTNVANLLLARASARRREMALRMSVGAGRLRIVRQLLTESVLLASLGGALGVVFAVWGMRVLTVLLANGRPDFTLHAQLNGQVLGVAAALSVLTGVLFGLAPALQATRVDVMPALKDTRGGPSPARHSFWRIRLQSPGPAALPGGCAQGRTQGPRNFHSLRRSTDAVRGDPRRAPRDAGDGFADPGIAWTAYRKIRLAIRSRQPLLDRRAGLLRDHADPDPGRPRFRGNRPRRLAVRGGDQRGVCQGEFRRPPSAGPALDPPRSRRGRPRRARHGDRRCLSQRALRRPDQGHPARGLHAVRPGLPAAERDGLRAAHDRRSTAVRRLRA